MARIGALAHDQFPGDVCIPYHNAAESIGEESADVPDALLQLDTLMMSEGPCPAGRSAAQYEQHGHYMNLVSKEFTHTGIGVVVKNGGVWLKEDFTG